MREDTRANRTVTNNRTRIDGDDRIDADMLRSAREVMSLTEAFERRVSKERNT